MGTQKLIIKELRSRYNRVHNLFSEYERLNALRRAIERDKEIAKRKSASEYYENIIKRMEVIEIKLSKYLSEVKIKKIAMNEVERKLIKTAFDWYQEESKHYEKVDNEVAADLFLSSNTVKAMLIEIKKNK